MNNILKVTKSRWFTAELNGEKFYLLNQRALVYFLRKQIGWNQTAIASFTHMFEYQDVVEVDLNMTERKVS